MPLPFSSTLWTTLTRQTAWLKRVGWTVCGLLGAWLIAWLALPPLLQWQLQKQGSAYLGRTLTIQQVQFRPWSLELTLQGLQLAPAQGQQTQLSIDRLYLDVELQSLLRLAPVIDAVTVEHPHLNVRHLGQGQTDLDDVIAKLNTPDDGSPPARFAVFNIRVLNGEADLTDEPAHTQHTLRQLELGIPFLSNFGSRREVLTQPHLSFQFNGTPINTTAQSTPFAPGKHTQAQLHIDALDLTAYQPYWPKNWPIQLQSGLLSTDLQVVFEEQESPHVTLSGTIQLQKLELLDTSTRTPSPLLQSQNLSITLDQTEPLSQQLRIGSIQWQQPQWHLQRDAKGTLNLERIGHAFSRLSPAPQRPNKATEAATEAASPWHLSLTKLDLQDGTIHWADATTQPAAQLQLQRIALHAQNLQWPSKADSPLQGQAQLNGATLTWSGTASANSALVKFDTQDLPLSTLSPYWAQYLTPTVQGQFGTQGHVQWKAAQGKKSSLVILQLDQTTLDHLALTTPEHSGFSADKIQADTLRIDLTQQRLQLDKLTLERPQLQAGRNRQGQWMYQSWLQPSRDESAKDPATPTRTSSANRPWQLALDQLQLNQGQLRWEDEQTSPRVRLQLADIDIQLKKLAWPSQPKTSTSLQARLQVQDARRKRPSHGSIGYQGQLQLTPNPNTNWQTQGQLSVHKLPLEALEPYFASSLNLELVRASTQYQGSLQAGMTQQGLDLQLQGQLAIQDFHANTRNPAEDLLRWKNLQFDKLKLNIAQGQLRQLHVQQTTLDDYYARVIVQANGRINLQDLTRTTPTQAALPTAPPSGATASRPAPPADIRFGPITVVKGSVDFSDHFIQPNYSASLSQLTGSLGSFQSTTPSQDTGNPVADLSLQGYVQGHAPLQITGKLNPLSAPLELDIHATANDLDLPPLTPYSLKYIGHGIERGKLSMDVAYNIDNSGQLEANNRIVLNQLTLGPRDSDSHAPRLPIELALALLADSQGNVQVNLPISGSINDPDFHLGSIIVRLFINLIGKALTSPFTLLAHALGGGEELNTIEFPMGQASLSSSAQQKLKTIAQAMQDKPSLQLTITGSSHWQNEAQAYRQAKLEKSLLAEKRRRWEKEGSSDALPQSYNTEERASLLKAVYRRADIPKPRNWVGMAKDLPEAEMEALLQASYTVTEQTMENLANERAIQVQQQLIEYKIAPGRLFLAAPQSAGPSQASLSLSQQR